MTNILFIVADDLNSWIGALGRNPNVQTPNIDRLARRGTLFTHAYCTAPYCNASRMSVFTGCLPSTTGIYANEPLWDVPSRRMTFVEHLRAAGYYTFGAGKVFHGVFDYASAGREDLPFAKWREIENRPQLWDAFHNNTVEPLPDGRPLNGLFDFGNFESVPPMFHHFDWGRLPADRIAEMPDAGVVAAVSDFLQAPPSEPFFCAAGFYKPHLPWHVPGEFFDLYDPAEIVLPVVRPDDLDDVPAIAKNWALTPKDHELVTSRGQWRDAVHGYLAAISYCDSVIGEILEALENSRAAASTSVVLWGDNGFHLGEKLHWRKFVLWEEATRVPLIIARPTDDEGTPSRVYAPVSLVDVYPTILELCGLPAAENIDGVSLTPLLDNPAMQRDAPAIMTWGCGNHSVRTKEWRYTRYHDGSEELYDHQTDTYEWTNLAGVGAFESVIQSLTAALPASK